MSKHTTSAWTWPTVNPSAGDTTNAVAFHPFSVITGWSNLITDDPLSLKLPLNALSPVSQKASDVKEIVGPPALVAARLIGPTLV